MLLTVWLTVIIDMWSG